MSEYAPRLLFVPVSGEFGMGEYARSLAIALGAQCRWPRASILFVLSRRAPYAAGTPFPITLLDSSPTFHTAAVLAIMRDWHPDAVIFDNAGRTAQLRSAKRLGARVVYISARPRQRHKAFRLAWMRVMDEHWIAYPRFIAGELTGIERLKLAVMRRPQIRYLDVILAPEGAADGVRARGGGEAREYVLVVPGGGTGHPRTGDSVGRFLEAARRLAARGIDTLFVGRATHAAAEVAPQALCAGSRLRLLGVLPQRELAGLMQGARLIVANGGSTLLQAIACGRPCIAVPIAGDQAARIRRCVSTGVAVAAPLDAAAIETLAADLLNDEPALRALAGRASAVRLADGCDVAVRALAALLSAP